MQCRASKTPTSTAFPLAPYLLRELMNFSLARLLTSFKAPSSGLPLINASDRRLFPPKGNRWKSSFAWLVESEFLPPPRSYSTGAKEPFNSISENGVERVKLYREYRLDTKIVFSIVIFPSKAPFHHKLHL